MKELRQIQEYLEEQFKETKKAYSQNPKILNFSPDS